MIISASRRTDIPAWYSDWFMNRVHAGWCAVPNPRNMNQLTRISLVPDEVTAIIFWSKNPAPMLKHIKELERIGLRYYFQFTLNDYPTELEPNLPNINERVQTFLDLSRLIGAGRVVWRYDPIIISNYTDYTFHLDRFSRLAEELGGATKRVMLSIVDYYEKTDRRLKQLENEGYSFDKECTKSKNMITLMTDIVNIARSNNIDIFTCAEERDYSAIGIPPGKCIDQDLVNRLWSLTLNYRKDGYQRKACLCHASKDIGINDTCIHGCRYCYSTRDIEIAEKRYKEHNPLAPVLWWPPQKDLIINEINNIQQKLF